MEKNNFIDKNKSNITYAVLIGGGALLAADAVYTVWKLKKFIFGGKTEKK